MEAGIVIEPIQYILYIISGRPRRRLHTNRWQTHMSCHAPTGRSFVAAPPAPLRPHKHPLPKALFRPISRTTSGLVTRTSVYSHSRHGHSHESGSAGNDRGATCAATLAPPPGGLRVTASPPLWFLTSTVSHPARLPRFPMLRFFSFLLLLQSEF